jgi:hypothetical protein
VSPGARGSSRCGVLAFLLKSRGGLGDVKQVAGPNSWFTRLEESGRHIKHTLRWTILSKRKYGQLEEPYYEPLCERRLARFKCGLLANGWIAFSKVLCRRFHVLLKSGEFAITSFTHLSLFGVADEKRSKHLQASNFYATQQ